MLYEHAVGPGEEGRPRHASAALPALEDAAEAAGGWDAVSRVAVGVGPGSFTGLRIGIATARASAMAAGVELVGVPSLDALARPAMAEWPDRAVLAAIDARRGQIFAALFTGGERTWGPLVIDPGELAGRLLREDGPPLAVGSGPVRFRGELEASAEIVADRSELHRIAPGQVCALGSTAPVGAPPEPLYLRPPDAERWRDRNAPTTTRS